MATIGGSGFKAAPTGYSTQNGKSVKSFRTPIGVVNAWVISRRVVEGIRGVRTPFCRANGAFTESTNMDLMSASLKGLVQKFGLFKEHMGEVGLGTVFFPPSTWNFARDVSLTSGLPRSTPAFGMQRACATSLDASIVVANKIALGRIESGISGGSESLTNLSLYLRPALSRRIIRTAQGRGLGTKFSAWKGFSFGDLKLGTPGAVEPLTGMSMGQHCEEMAKEWKIPRREGS